MQGCQALAQFWKYNNMPNPPWLQHGPENQTLSHCNPSHMGIILNKSIKIHVVDTNPSHD